MRYFTIATVLSLAAAGLAAPWGEGAGAGLVSLPPSIDSSITLCCSGSFAVPVAVGGTPTCVAYNSPVPNCAAGQVKFDCPVTRGVLTGCSDPSGAAAAQNIVQEVLNLVPALLNLNL
ncbi:uncharacterized protein CDV56_103433 [Aspergillus thermomutatus]|uniref:Hydrophobin n=1 Tax=Aspergillus thermomutatus TaxID=41047 RepID=A0A397GZU5_ASPTH|nr:uncharacterized protein CDV56_103433 [Aspergillus thermomutatus]RHZ55158.1 hypothetical protein CDV56_103433 [Aspergillus thermomutatus]